MPVERFIWTLHAEMRLAERGLTRGDVEGAIRERDHNRQLNRGDADWRVLADGGEGRRLVVIYDNPVEGDPTTARIVSVWRLRA